MLLTGMTEHLHLPHGILRAPCTVCTIVQHGQGTGGGEGEVEPDGRRNVRFREQWAAPQYRYSSAR